MISACIEIVLDLELDALGQGEFGSGIDGRGKSKAHPLTAERVGL